jgi:hypothetical protein
MGLVKFLPHRLENYLFKKYFEIFFIFGESFDLLISPEEFYFLLQDEINPRYN